MELKEIIAKNLLELRKTKNITQLELAEKFNYSDKSVSKWERAEAMPDIETLYNLASFYGVTLDYLTTEGEHKVKNKEIKDKQKSKNKLLITLLSATLVWFIACATFVALKLCLNINYWLSFVWALPVTCIVLIVFNGIWGKRIYKFIILTVLNWSLLVAVYLQIANPAFWPLFILGFPIQVAILFWGKIKRLKIFDKKDKKKIQSEEENIEK